MNNHLIERYYIGHRDELLAFVSSRLGGSRESEDIVQNVFLRLLVTDKLITENTLPALVFTIACNLIRDYYRRRHSYETFEHFIKQTATDAVVGDNGQPEQESVYSAWELTKLMERGLARVPENCREVYRMHIYGGMKVSEISQTLCEGYKSVEHRLGTARKAVREYLRNYA